MDPPLISIVFLINMLHYFVPVGGRWEVEQEEADHSGRVDPRLYHPRRRDCGRCDIQEEELAQQNMHVYIYIYIYLYLYIYIIYIYTFKSHQRWNTMGHKAVQTLDRLRAEHQACKFLNTCRLIINVVDMKVQFYMQTLKFLITHLNYRSYCSNVMSVNVYGLYA